MPSGIKKDIIDARGARVKTIISTEGANELDVQNLKPGNLPPGYPNHTRGHSFKIYQAVEE